MSKLITVLGNDGKTLLSYYLAQRLASSQKRCMIISTNSSNPNVRYVMPLIDSKKSASLGRILSLAVIDNQSILDNVMTFNNENIGLISYAMNENKNNYPGITKVNLDTFFSLLPSIVDYIIVDTQTTRNKIDDYALGISDTILCVTTADMKGLAYRQQLPIEKEIVHILYNNSKYNPFEDIKNTYKYHVKYIMPYCKNLQYVYNGALLDDVSDCTKAYKHFIDKLIKEIQINE